MEEIAFTAAMRQTADGLFLLDGLDGAAAVGAGAPAGAL